MQDSGREWEHFQFIQSTDRKSLHTQIKALVTKAKEVATEELQERSNRLKALLEMEDKVYEEEFANKVKTRLDEDIRARKEHLHAIKEQHDIRHKKFLNERRVRQVMENCYEIREALRQEDRRNTKICLEEQMVENLRKKRRECEIENYWRKLEDRRWAEYDRVEHYEKCKREQLKGHMCRVLNIQVCEQEEKRELEREEKRQEAREIAKVLEEMRLEKFEEDHRSSNVDKLKYREELLAEIERRRAERQAEWLANKEEHAAFIRETQRLEAEARARIDKGKQELNQATLEFIAYVRRMRVLENSIEKMLDDRTADLHHVDICTKSNIAETARLKSEEAARCHSILKQQICEEAERRLRWDAEARENKIIENRFVHPPVTREMILQQYRENRRGLDEQIVELQRIRKEEEKQFKTTLLKAIDDPEECTKLAAQYLLDGTDYLPPHPNWKIYACPRHKYVERPPMTSEELDSRIKKASVDLCPCPESARRHCGFMATQEPHVKVNGPPRLSTQQVHLDVPPEGQTLMAKKPFASCYCPK